MSKSVSISAADPSCPETFHLPKGIVFYLYDMKGPETSQNLPRASEKGEASETLSEPPRSLPKRSLFYLYDGVPYTAGLPGFPALWCVS